MKPQLPLWVDIVGIGYDNEMVKGYSPATVQRLINEAYEAGKADAREWLPIADAPRDGSVFLGYLRGDVYKASVVPMVGGGERWVFGPRHYGREVEPTPTPTHWMHLPPPPKEFAK